MDKLTVRAFGPINEGTVEFGDLTVLVGPQASGKSLLVQLLKAIEDRGFVRKMLKQHGFSWLHGSNRLGDFLTIYFGGGMQSVWSNRTSVAVDGSDVDFLKRVIAPSGNVSVAETVFLIPAQRVLVLQDGWPRPFMSYAPGDPFCVRNFSDAIRRLMEQGLGGGKAIFPQEGRLKSDLRRLVADGIYMGGELVLEKDALRKRVVLVPPGSKEPIPAGAWSAGQREFTPLLLGLYWLMPGSKTSTRQGVQTVVIEEPEMGLHPQAIISFCLIMLELLHRGYKVIVSTHSPVVLDIVWALRELGETDSERALQALKGIFGIPRLTPGIRAVLGSALSKCVRTYYFERRQEGVGIRDISTLDPCDDDPAVAGWGGLSGFSGEIADTVGEALAVGDRH